MPLTIYERNQTRSFNLTGKTVGLTRNWFVSGSTNEAEVHLATMAASVPFFDGLVRNSINADHQEADCWYVAVGYANIDPQQVLAPDGQPGGGGTVPEPESPGGGGPGEDMEDLGASYSFDTTGATAHIGLSLGTKWYSDSSGHFIREDSAQNLGFTLDNNRVIGSSHDSVAGVDIFVPRFEWTRQVTRASVRLPYLRTLRNMTGRINDKKFYGFPKGDVLYMGATGSVGGGRWTITHKFACEETQFDIQVGNGIPADRKSVV